MSIEDIYKKAVRAKETEKRIANDPKLSYDPSKITPLKKAIEKKKKEEQEKNIQQQQDKGREETLRRAPEVQAAEKKKAEKALSDFDEKAEYDRTDKNARKQYEAERKNLQAAVEKSGAELARREKALYDSKHPQHGENDWEMDKNIREAGKKYDSTFYDPNDGGAYHARKAREKEEREAARAAEAETLVPKAKPSMEDVRKQYQDSIAALEDYKKNNPIPITGGFGPEQGQMDTSSEQYRKMAELESRAESLKRQMESMEDQEVTDKNMAAIEAMTPEARKHLETLTNLNSASKYYGTYSGGQVNTDLVQETARSQQEAREALAAMGYSADEIRNLASSLSRYNNARDAREMAENTQQLADDHPVVGNLLSLVTNVSAGPAGTMEALGSMIAPDSQYKTADPNMPGYSAGMFTEGVRGETSKNIRESGPAGAALDIGYKGIMGAADNIVRLYAGGGGKVGSLLLSSTGAFQSTFRESVQNGDPTWKAALSGVVDAGIEEVTEKYSLDALLDDPVPITSLKQMVKTALKQGAVEASEEEVGLVLNVFADLLINGDRNEMTTSIQDMVANGKSYEEAQRAYVGEKAHEALDTALTSMVSGAGMSVGNNIAVGNTPRNNANFTSEYQGEQAQAAPSTPDNSDFHVTPDGEAIPVNNDQQTQEAPDVASWTDGLKDQTPPPPPKTPVQEQFDQAAQATANGTPVDEAPAPGESPDASQTPPDRMSMSEEDFLNSMGGSGPEADPFADRSWHEVGKRSEKAFMAQNPEVKPLFQDEAAMMYSELVDTTRGERTFNEDAYYQSGGEAGWSGTKRHTSGSIEELLDSGFTYDQIEKGLMSIMEDHGAENNAAAKRIEFIINDRLLNGYTNFYDGRRVPPSADYASFVNGQSAQGTDTPNMSVEGEHRFEAMGAADQNFTGKPAYNATLSEENHQADRRDDVRPMELPKTDVNGDPVSATTGNAYASKITTDDLASLMEEPVARGDFSYMKITNDRATQMAAETIGKSTTWEDAFEQWVKEVDRGIAGAEISARGALFLNRAAQTGDKQQYLSTLHNIQKLGTNTAQGLQAMRLIRSLSPPDKIDFMRLTVERMSADLKLGNKLEIDETLISEYDNAKTDKARDAVVEKIQEHVAAQIPSTFMDKFTALRYTNMLGNIKTNVRNVAGNVGSGLMYRIKDGVAAGIEALTHKLTGAERTKKLFVTDRDLLKACKEDFRIVSDIVGDGGKYGDKMSAYGEFSQGVMDKRRIFKSNAKDPTARAIGDTLLAPMEAYRKVTNWAMNNGAFGDEAFGRAAYSRALAGYLEINGMSAKEFRQVIETGEGNTALVDRARAYAVQQAQEATFHDNTAMARVMRNLQKAGGPVVGQGIMPFTKTPANVLTRAEEFSPLGVINSTVKSIQKARGDVNISGADLIDSWAKTVTGSGIFALGAWMMSQGLFSGAPDDDDDKAQFDKMNGVQSYAINLPGGKSYTLDWLSPAAMPFFMGGELMKVIEEGGELSFADLEKVFTSIADPMLQMSMLQGINDSLDNIKYTDDNIGQFVINAALNYLLQGVSNTMLGQIERSTEKNRTTTYVDKDSGVPVWMQRELGKLSQKIPGWDYQQTDYLDAWGQEQKNEGGLLYNLASPGYLSKEKAGQLNDELYRLHESTGKNVFPQSSEKTVTYTDTSGEKHMDYNLSEKEFAAMQKEEGQTAARLLSEIIQNKDYNKLTDAQRAAVVADVYEYAREQGRKAALPDYHSEANSWVRNAGTNPVNSIIQRAALSQINSSVSDSIGNIKNGWNVAEASRQEMDGFYDSFKSMSKAAQAEILESAIGDTAKYLEMRSNGLTTDEYLSVERRVKALGSTGVKDIQKYEAIVNTPTLSAKDKDAAIMAYMTDYNPDAASPETTELKYQYARQEMGLTPEQYIKALRVNADGGKKAEKIAAWKEQGYSDADANILYRLLCATGKAKIDVKTWHSNQ